MLAIALCPEALLLTLILHRHGITSNQTSSIVWCVEHTGGHVGREELPEIGARVVPREEVLDRVFEGKVEGLCGEVADNIGQVAAPERGNALLCRHPREAVDDACRC